MNAAAPPAATAMSSVEPRRRSVLALALVGVIAIGLASRRHPGLFPALFGKYPGDALWALMVYLGVAVLTPAASVTRVAVVAAAIAGLVEAAQLYQAPWISAVRATTLGHLALGSTFAWRDLAAYAVGLAAGVLADPARTTVQRAPRS